MRLFSNNWRGHMERIKPTGAASMRAMFHLEVFGDRQTQLKLSCRNRIPQLNLRIGDGFSTRLRDDVNLHFDSQTKTFVRSP